MPDPIIDLEEDPKNKSTKTKIKNIFMSLLPYLIIIAVVLFIRAYLVVPIRVNGDSMSPTLERNQFMLLNRLSYRTTEVERFDIVVIQYGNRPLIKRVIGLPGEVIEYNQNRLYVNNNFIEETFEREPTTDFKITDLEIQSIPNGKFLVMGDNRPESIDGRHLGLFSQNEILGRANFVIFPLSDWGTKR